MQEKLDKDKYSYYNVKHSTEPNKHVRMFVSLAKHKH